MSWYPCPSLKSMSKKTEMLIKPTLEECVAHAAKIGLPLSEGKKFFHHYESVGWMVGRNPMVGFKSAMSGWMLRWEERTGKCEDQPPKLSGADKMIRKGELDRVLERLKALEASYDSHLEMRADDRTEYFKLRKRRDVLRKELGIEY